MGNLFLTILAEYECVWIPQSLALEKALGTPAYRLLVHCYNMGNFVGRHAGVDNLRTDRQDDAAVPEQPETGPQDSRTARSGNLPPEQGFEPSRCGRPSNCPTSLHRIPGGRGHGVYRPHPGGGDTEWSEGGATRWPLGWGHPVYRGRGHHLGRLSRFGRRKQKRTTTSAFGFACGAPFGCLRRWWFAFGSWGFAPNPSRGGCPCTPEPIQETCREVPSRLGILFQGTARFFSNHQHKFTSGCSNLVRESLGLPKSSPAVGHRPCGVAVCTEAD